MSKTPTLHRNDARRAIVVGGSMSGLLAGLMLRRAGWQVDIYERTAEELSGRGAGIVAQPELIATLQRLGLDTRDLGVSVRMRRIFDSGGRLAVERECPQVLTAWERVYRILRDGFPPRHYHRGRELSGFAQDAAGVVAHFADGGGESGDLLIGADGLRSTVRRLCLPHLEPLYAGYVAWRALVPEQAFAPSVHRDLFECMAFCLPPGEQMLGYPVAGPDNDLRAGRRRYNLVWYRPANERTELPRLLTDRNGVTHAISIPPPLIGAAVVADMQQAARRLLAPQFVEIIATVSQPILQPIYDLETTAMACGRVAILGDAAFVARPHVAAGVSKAADDAAALAAALSQCGEVEAALRRFEAARLPVGRRIVRQARHLGAYLQAERTGAQERDSAQRHSLPESILRETALTDFLDD